MVTTPRTPIQRRVGDPAAIFESSSVRQALVSVVALKIAGIVLVIDVAGYQAFDFPKSLFSRSTGWLLAALIVIAIVRFGPGVIPRTRLHLAVVALVLVNALSALQSDNTYLALYGEQDSYVGLTFLVDMLILYFAVAIAFTQRSDWVVLAGSIGLAALIAIGYAGVQYLGLDPVPWSASPRIRPFGTFGNPDHFGQFLSLAFGLSVGILVGAAGRWSASLRVVAVLFTLVIVATVSVVATRGSLVGLLAVVLCLPLLHLRLHGFNVRAMAAITALESAAIAVLVLSLTLSPLGDRVAATLRGAEIQSRTVIYGTAIRAFLDRPILGYGLGNFSVAYPKYRSADSAIVARADLEETSAHSWILQAAATTGIVGVVTLILLIAACTLSLWRAVIPRAPPVGAALLLGWIAYWTHGLVGVGTIGVDWFPWIALGACATLGERRLVIVRSGAIQSAVAVLLVGVGLVGASLSVNALVANRGAGLARNTAEVPRVTIAAAADAVRRDPGRGEYWNLLGFTKEQLSLWREAAEAYGEATRRAPHIARYWSNLALSTMRESLASGAPDQGAAAIAAASRAVSVDPNQPHANIVLSEVALAFGQCDLALRSAVTALTLHQDDSSFDRFAARAAACASDRQLASHLLGQGVEVKDSVVLHIALAEVALQLGDKESARRHAQRALELQPGNRDAQRILNLAR
jgi:O-antigen ligase/tetratricopeptide (TPR) repeat protein